MNRCVDLSIMRKPNILYFIETANMVLKHDKPQSCPILKRDGDLKSFVRAKSHPLANLSAYAII
jgi:hypothetical protein